MDVELDWQAADENGVWEPVAVVARPHGRTQRHRVWYAGTAVLLFLAAGCALVTAQRYDRARDRIAFQIQSVIDLENKAFAQGNVELFLAQQDSTLSSWYRRRAACAVEALRPGRSEASSPCAAILADIAPGGAAPNAPPQVQAVGLRGDVAWAEVVSAPDDTRQVRFYRRTRQGWLHAAPDGSYWGKAVAQTRDSWTIYCRERDLAYIDPLIEHIIRTDRALCATLGCPAAEPLALQFVPYSTSPALLADRVVLASPWLSGIPSEGEWAQEYLDELAYWAAYARASGFVRSNEKRQAGEAGPLNEVQQAVVGEYAALYSHRGDAEAPLLGRLAGAYGTGAMEQALRSVQDGPTASQFLARWPLAFPDRQERAGFEALVKVAQEAVQAGQPDTLALAAELLAAEGTWQAGTVEYLHALN
jgi:hypothetical protein